MTKEEKQLLLQDLCARLPYGVKCYIKFDDGKTFTERTLAPVMIQDFKKHSFISFIPYLRPMSSMTEEEKKEFKDTFNGLFQYFNHGIISDSRVWNRNEAVFVGELSCSKLIDWLKEHDFDYSGLIGKGLAEEKRQDWLR